MIQHQLFSFNEVKVTKYNSTNSILQMSITVIDLKRILSAHQIDWNPLFDIGVKTEPFYFGIYKTVQKPGYHSAEKLFEKRLSDLIQYLDSLTFSDDKALTYLNKIKSFQAKFDRDVNFNSEAFRVACRDLIKPMKRFTMESKNTLKLMPTVRPYVNAAEKRIIDTYLHQLNPHNYSYSYLTHFLYVSNEGVQTLLVDNNRKKSVRRLDQFSELTHYICTLEIPRRTNKTALAYRYFIFENNPCRDCEETLIFQGVNFSTNAGVGYKEEWQKDSTGKWFCHASFEQWRR